MNPFEQLINRPKRRRGFAAIPSERQREIASMGGKAVHAQGKGHKWIAGDPFTIEMASLGGNTPRKPK